MENGLLTGHGSHGKQLGMFVLTLQLTGHYASHQVKYNRILHRFGQPQIVIVMHGSFTGRVAE